MIHKNVNEKQHNSRLDNAATSLYEDFSRSQIQRWISQGNLLVNGEILKAKDKVHTGDEISLDPIFENRVSWEGEDIPINILHEEEDFLIVNKSPGLVMHPGAGCHNGTLANALAFHFPELKQLPRCGIVHRLDKDTSGLLVVAKNEKFRNFFINKLQDRVIYKKYEAIVVGKVIASFSIDHSLERDPRNRIKMSVTDFGRDALSHVSLIKFYAGYSHVSVEIETGRTHQIRVHMSYKGNNILGDKKYKKKFKKIKNIDPLLEKNLINLNRQFLHAKTIGFIHPKKKEEMVFNSILPQELEIILKMLRNTNK